MVYGVVIALNGHIGDVSIPAKTSDVLDWIRKKYKCPTIQFQGKLQDPLVETRWLSVFASTEGDDENTHMLPSPFDEDTYTSQIIVLATNSDNQDSYELPMSSYTDLRADEYDNLYQEWTFAVDEEEGEDEEILDELEEDDATDSVVLEDDEEVVHVAPVVRASKPATIRTNDVFVSCAIREKVISNFSELFGSTDMATDFELFMLQALVERAKKDCIDVDWANRTFWNMYRSRSISLYENILGQDSYVKNDENLLEKIKSGELGLKQVAEMTSMDMCPSRWKEAIEKIIEQETKLYSSQQNASIVMWCSSCKKKTKCDYYQLQTRSADEPMTTFVTCLECDRRWKF